MVENVEKVVCRWSGVFGSVRGVYESFDGGHDAEARDKPRGSREGGASGLAANAGRVELAGLPGELRRDYHGNGDVGATQEVEFAHQAIYEGPEAGHAIQQPVDFYCEFERRHGMGGQKLIYLNIFEALTE